YLFFFFSSIRRHTIFSRDWSSDVCSSDLFDPRPVGAVFDVGQGQFWGHPTYIDHGPDGPRVKGTGVTVYKVVNPTTRHIEGTAQVNGQDGFTYQVDVADNGEPGRSDTFTLQLSGGYGASGTLAGGNIQLHVPSCQ